MAGTKEGALKARERNLAKDPDFYKKIGGQSWKNPDRSRKTGFANIPREKHIELSRKGGKKTKIEYMTAEEFRAIIGEDDEYGQVETTPKTTRRTNLSEL